MFYAKPQPAPAPKDMPRPRRSTSCLSARCPWRATAAAATSPPGHCSREGAMLRIWGRTNSINVQKVMWAVGELGLAHERIDAGGEFGGLDTAEYGGDEPEPQGADDRRRRRGLVGIQRLRALSRGALRRRRPVGRGPGRARPRGRWMDWQAATLLPDMGVVFWGLVRTPEAQRDHAAIDAAAAGGSAALADPGRRSSPAATSSPAASSRSATSRSAPPATATTSCRSSGRGCPTSRLGTSA